MGSVQVKSWIRTDRGPPRWMATLTPAAHDNLVPYLSPRPETHTRSSTNTMSHPIDLTEGESGESDRTSSDVLHLVQSEPNGSRDGFKPSAKLVRVA